MSNKMFALLMSTVLVHPFHVSICEAEWNAKSERFELAMRLDPRDLTTALSKMARRRVDLEALTPDAARELMIQYVNSRFKVSDDQAMAAQWRWVGLENETKFVWVYLELQPRDNAKSLSLKNELLFEVAPSQLNTIVLKSGSVKQTLQFSRKQSSQILQRINNSWRLSSL